MQNINVVACSLLSLPLCTPAESDAHCPASSSVPQPQLCSCYTCTLLAPPQMFSGAASCSLSLSPSYRLGPHDTIDADVRLHSHHWPLVFLEQRFGCEDWGRWLQNVVCPGFKRV